MAISDMDCGRGCDAQMSVAIGQEWAAEDDACMIVGWGHWKVAVGSEETNAKTRAFYHGNGRPQLAL